MLETQIKMTPELAAEHGLIARNTRACLKFSAANRASRSWRLQRDVERALLV